MKALVWKLVQRWFDYEIKLREDAFHSIKSLQRENDKVTINYPVGTKVIIRSNEPEPFVVCKVDAYCTDKKGRIYAIQYVRDDGEVFMTLNTSPCYYHPAIEEALNKLEWYDQWNVLTGRGLCIRDPKEAERTEGYTYGDKSVGVQLTKEGVA